MIAILSGYRGLRLLAVRRRVAIVSMTFILAASLALIFGIIPTFVTGQPWLGWGALPLLGLPIGIGMAVAVVFYRLFDIRVVIQRTLVWSTLTGLIIIVYIVVVGGLSTLFQTQGSPIFALIATGLTAVLFHPLRMRLSRVVSARLYGERDTPYQVILRLTDRLDATITPDDAFAQIVRTIGEGLKLPYAAIDLHQDHRFVRAAAWGKPLGTRVAYPITCGDETVGRLLVTPRSTGEALTSGDQELLTGLIYHAEIAVRTARLTTDLQQSRERLVAAREEERRRLRRDLHDGLGPTLASLTLQLDATRNLLKSNPNRVDPLLISLREQVQAALEDVRRRVYELRPPALDELGLIGAIREAAQRFELDGGLHIVVETPESLPPLPAAVEVAAYRIALEALTNVIRHARATACHLLLTLEQDLYIEVRDNGRGLPEIPRRGVGLSSMVERAAELGGRCVIERAADGGTRLMAHLPVQTARMEQLK